MDSRSTYLRDHDAAARGGVQLFVRIARSQRDRAWGASLADLRDEVIEDWESLRGLLAEFHVRPAPVSNAAVSVAEMISRWKRNGRTFHRTPLTDLIEIEAAQDAVHAKQSGWQALIDSGADPSAVDLGGLSERAERQREELSDIHALAARQALRPARAER